VTRERIRQIEAKTLRKLKHPHTRANCAAFSILECSVSPRVLVPQYGQPSSANITNALLQESRCSRFLQEVRFARDSPLEEAGFEPRSRVTRPRFQDQLMSPLLDLSVPRGTTGSQDRLMSPLPDFPPTRNSRREREPKPAQGCWPSLAGPRVRIRLPPAARQVRTRPHVAVSDLEKRRGH